jgi:hypothetical protein
MDVGALKAGDDFVEHIHSAVGSAAAFIVVIGRGWLNARDEDGARRLDDPADFVRTEVALALAGKPVVIPVLVGGAVMPDEEDLPPDLVELAHRHAVTLVHEDWEAGIARLTAALRDIVGAEPEEAEEEPEPPVVPPVELEEERTEPAARIPLVATALGLAGAVGLVAGTWLQADLWAHPVLENSNSVRGELGYFESVAALTVVVGAVGSLLLSYARGAARLATGLFLGFALAGVARYVSVLGVLSSTGIERRYPESSSRFGPGAWIALIGCTLIAAAALVRISADREERDPRAFVVPRLLVLGGAALVVVATTVPYTTSASLNAQTVFERITDWYAFEPIASAVFAVAVALFFAQARTAASGALIALGGFLGLLWASRYIGFPAWQVYDAGSVGLGGFLGLGGGLAILIGGLRARPRPAGYSVGVVSAASSRR